MFKKTAVSVRYFRTSGLMKAAFIRVQPLVRKSYCVRAALLKTLPLNWVSEDHVRHFQPGSFSSFIISTLPHFPTVFSKPTDGMEPHQKWSGWKKILTILLGSTITAWVTDNSSSQWSSESWSQPHSPALSTSISTRRTDSHCASLFRKNITDHVITLCWSQLLGLLQQDRLV